MERTRCRDRRAKAGGGYGGGRSKLEDSSLKRVGLGVSRRQMRARGRGGDEAPVDRGAVRHSRCGAPTEGSPARERWVLVLKADPAPEGATEGLGARVGPEFCRPSGAPNVTGRDPHGRRRGLPSFGAPHLRNPGRLRGFGRGRRFARQVGFARSREGAKGSVLLSRCGIHRLVGTLAPPEGGRGTAS